MEIAFTENIQIKKTFRGNGYHHHIVMKVTTWRKWLPPPHFRENAYYQFFFVITLVSYFGNSQKKIGSILKKNFQPGGDLPYACHVRHEESMMWTYFVVQPYPTSVQTKKNLLENKYLSINNLMTVPRAIITFRNWPKNPFQQRFQIFKYVHIFQYFLQCNFNYLYYIHQ